MGEQRQMRSRSWNRMPGKRCSASGIMNEFIVVDDDEVIILDIPESSKSKASDTSRTGNESVWQRVISIDDDDDDDADDDRAENVHKAGSSSRYNSHAANLQTSEEVDNDDCQFIQEKCAAFRFSKCKQIFSTMPSHGVRFGLGSESESDFSESDCSDCEIFESSHREVREQWEKAFLKKMKKAGKAGLSEEEAGPSNLHCDTGFGPSFESRTEQHDQTSSFFAARNPDHGKETSSSFFGTDNRNPNTSLFGSDMEEDNRAKTSRYSRFFSKEDFPMTSSLSPEKHERSDSPSTDFTSSKEPIHQNSSQMEEENQAQNSPNSRFFSKEDFPGTSSLSPEKQAEQERSDSPPTDFTSSEELKHQNSFKEVEEHSDTVQDQRETSQSPKENPKKKAEDQSYTEEEKGDGDGDKTNVLGTQKNGARFEHVISSLGESREPIIDPIPSTSGQVQDGTAPAIDIMLNREMLKETYDYKKAQEEEWESRQRQLQLQAEEAQRQRKRRKLENTRQLEVERRQKERVEEVRETQKKDEESMNMKEKIRADITNSLKLIELKSINMASLLRSLGIPVSGGAFPLPQEVHAAYKRAVLKFHPDRASRGNIEQQVEAEEKFKLIARMKDTFLS